MYKTIKEKIFKIISLSNYIFIYLCKKVEDRSWHTFGGQRTTYGDHSFLGDRTWVFRLSSKHLYPKTVSSAKQL